MAARLTLAQQRARFGGFTTKQAHALRDTAPASMSAEQIAAARAAWVALDREGGQPWQWPRHPEAVRFHLMRLLVDGVPLDDAVAQTRMYAKEP